VEVLLHEPEHLKWNGSLQSKGPKSAKTLEKKLEAAKYSKPKSIWCIKNAMSTAPLSPVTSMK
jgi:hypothetical protein